MAQVEKNQAALANMHRRFRERTEQAAELLHDEVVRVIGSGETDVTEAGVARSEPGEPPEDQSGELEASIEIFEVNDAKRDTTLRVGSELIKAWFLEFGTGFMEPRPFMRPALENVRGDMLAILRGQA